MVFRFSGTENAKSLCDSLISGQSNVGILVDFWTYGLFFEVPKARTIHKLENTPY